MNERQKLKFKFEAPNIICKEKIRNFSENKRLESRYFSEASERC